MNFRFDFYDLPLDVIWLDIDVTNEFEYFTWNPHRFANATLDVMYDRLAAAHRKLVVISDPHIRKNDSYFLYSYFKSLENPKVGDDEEYMGPAVTQKYFVRDPYKFNSQDDSFEGNCWPGKSVWPDFLQKRVRHVWAA